MVIRLDGWGLARRNFIGVSMEKEWSGRRWARRRRGDHTLCNRRAHAFGARQVSENSGK